jgi:very-short-patch-repair endonuclease
MNEEREHPPFLSYDLMLKDKARENRRNPTTPERIFWNNVLRNRQFMNLKFTRQKPIGHFIADFYCSELLLVVEVDGDSHAGKEVYDQERTMHFNSQGVSIVRFTNEDIMRRLDGVYRVLQEKVAELKGKKTLGAKSP